MTKYVSTMGSYKPLISIIVPVYNVQNYLSLCVDSLLEQTYNNIEIILVDDGSPDSCSKMCDVYAQRDDRIMVIHKKNGGLADARNVAIDHANGEWLVCVDSDDYVSDDYIETLYNMVERNHCKVGVAKHQPFVEGTMPDKTQQPYVEMVFDTIQGIEKMFYQELFDTAAWAKIYHHSLFEGVRYPFGMIYEDLPTTYQLFLKADKIAFCNRVVYYYLLRNDSLDRQQFNRRKLDSALWIIESILSHANELHQIEKAVRCRLFSFCYHILLEMPADYPDNRKYVLMEFVKAHRYHVLLDGRARKKARCAAALSFLGISTLKKILRMVNKRKSSR